MAYTKEQIQAARRTDLLSYLEYQNELALREGRVAPYLIEKDGGQYRLKDHGGLLFVGNMWNQRSTGKGGNTLDFLTKYEGKTFTEAVELLNQAQGIQLRRVDPNTRYQKNEVPFVLPDRNESFRRAIAYLTKTRRIDAQLVLDEIKKGNIYEDSIYHNVVFVGRKPNGEPVWAQKRTTISDKKTIFDHPGSDARYGYYTGNPTPKIVVVVESPIEALSLVSLMKYHNKPIDQLGFLSLGGCMIQL